MIDIIIILFLSYYLRKFLERPLINKIKKSTNVEEAISIRGRIKIMRIAVFIVVLVAYMMYLSYSVKDMPPEQVRRVVLNVVFYILVYFIINKGANDVIGNISEADKETFLQANPNYSLYLRGFEQDNYSHLSKMHYGKFDRFCELAFTLILNEITKLCAVGMTKDIDSPLGADRIYLDDVNWKQDVYELMEKAQHIYILVDDRESCLWEIRTAIPMIRKVTFIVDDLEKYKKMRAALNKELYFPILLKHKDDEIQVVRFSGVHFKTAIYQNSIEGYAQLLGASDNTLKTIKAKFKRNKSAINLSSKVYLIVISILFVLLSILFYWLEHSLQ